VFAKQLGRTGLCIPEIGLGTWDYHVGLQPLRGGLEAGALFIDTAESYGTEPVVGQAIRGLRERVFLATKVSPENFRIADLHRAAEDSLRRLGTDVIDLLQLHAPNPKIPIEETMSAMTDLVDAGKVRFIGVSNFSVPQLREAQAVCRYPIVSNQVRYNLIDRSIENGLLGYCQANRITVIVYSPLARGLDRIRDCDPRGVLVQIAAATGKTAAQIVVNWCLCHPGVVAIPKGNSVEHVLENCGASDWRLTPTQLRLLDEKIQYRHRGRFDTFVRRHMPHSMHGIAVRVVNALPRGVRRRVI
jgi:diketogulonate reductase-like aldo/keto reductase